MKGSRNYRFCTSLMEVSKKIVEERIRSKYNLTYRLSTDTIPSSTKNKKMAIIWYNYRLFLTIWVPEELLAGT